MRGCDECGKRKGCTTRKLLRAVERECGVSVGVDGCDYRGDRTAVRRVIQILSTGSHSGCGGWQLYGGEQR